MTTPRTSTSRLGGRQPRFLAFAILAAAVAAGGCATTYQARVSTTPAVTPPAPWQAAAQLTSTAPAGDLSRWWQQLGDPAPTALVNDALTSNPDIRIAQARLQARAQRSLAAAQRLPSVTLSASDASPIATTAMTNSVSLGIDASKPDIFGRQRNAVDAADADATATALDLRAVHVSLSAEVALNHTSLRSAQARLDIARRNEASQAETRQLTEWRRDAGLATSLDVERARANHEQTRAQVASLGASIAQPCIASRP
jgi:outer membrane protein TolC